VRNGGLETDYLLHFQKALSKRYEKTYFFHLACGGKRSKGPALGIEIKNPCLQPGLKWKARPLGTP